MPLCSICTHPQRPLIDSLLSELQLPFRRDIDLSPVCTTANETYASQLGRPLATEEMVSLHALRNHALSGHHTQASEAVVPAAFIHYDEEAEAIVLESAVGEKRVLKIPSLARTIKTIVAVGLDNIRTNPKSVTPAQVTKCLELWLKMDHGAKDRDEFVAAMQDVIRSGLDPDSPLGQALLEREQKTVQGTARPVNDDDEY